MRANFIPKTRQCHAQKRLREHSRDTAISLRVIAKLPARNTVAHDTCCAMNAATTIDDESSNRT
jgi:hypothetical protein